MPKGVQFLKNALVGRNVGAVARSSKFVVTDVLAILTHRPRPNVIVEYGPGDGVLTQELLKILSPTGKMLAIEYDGNFVDILRGIKDSRLKVVQGSMEDVSNDLGRYGFSKVDLIVSSVPFSLIDKKEREEVVRRSAETLTPGGTFVIFHQYSLIMERVMKKYFKNVTSKFEPRNFLPCFIMTGEKK